MPRFLGEDLMKILIIAIITMTSGSVLEIASPSLERCEYWQASVRQGAKMEITDDGGIRETVLSVECKVQEVYVPEAEGWEL